MQTSWKSDEPAETDPATDFGPFGRVVPADGDPEVERYRAALRTRERPHTRAAWMHSRHALRNWTITLGAVALIVLFIKPLAVFAAVALAVMLALIVLAMLAAGALFFALRMTLGGRMAYYAGRGGTFRRAGRWQR